jgi:hypothetical protein
LKEGKPKKPNYGLKGLGKALKATLEGRIPEFNSHEAPVDMSVALAEGWHNLPSLYGKNVRPVQPITDFSSGVVTAGRVEHL